MSMVSKDDDAHRAAFDALQIFACRQGEFPAPTGLPLYKPRASDVIIATTPKSGTTLLQNLVYQIIVAAGGGPDFDPDGTQFEDINEVVPWVDYGPQMGTLSCETSPRLFKTHTNASRFNLNVGRFIFCGRDPSRIVGSVLDFLFDILTDGIVNDDVVREQVYHQFFRNMLLSVSEAADENVLEAIPIPFPCTLNVLRSWTQQRRDNVLVLFYEDVARDLRRTTRKIAAFLGVTLSEDDVTRVSARCSREAMLNDTRFVCSSEGRAFGIEGARKVQAPNRKGYNRFALDEEEQAQLADLMEKHTGYRTYEALVAGAKARSADVGKTWGALQRTV